MFEQGEVNHVGSFIVLYIDDYYPKRISREHLQEPSQRLISFKKGDSEAVDFYASKVLPYFKKGVILCCAPSSSKNEWGKGLELLLEEMSKKVPCILHADLICRTTSTEKRSIGGVRTPEQ
jgi:hypothetical protein